MNRPSIRFAKLTLVAVFLGILINLSGNVMWSIAQANYPPFPNITKHLMAAMLEPTTTKLVPAIGLIAYIRYNEDRLVDYIASNKLRLSVLFGFLAGFIEFALFLLKGTYLSVFVPLALTQVATCRAPPVFMHMVTGTLISLPIIWLIDYQPGDSPWDEVPLLSERFPTVTERFNDRLFLALAIGTILFLIAQFVHVWWNTGGHEAVGKVIGLSC